MLSRSGRTGESYSLLGPRALSPFRYFLRAMVEILLASIPLLLLVASLLAGFYPGFEAIVKISERFASRVRRWTTPSQAAPRRPVHRAASGGLLIAFGHAQRPPPLAS